MRKTKAMAAGGWLMALLVALLPVAGAQSQEVQLWKSATSGITYKLTIGVHRIAAEKVFPPEFQSQVERGAYVRCEYSERQEDWTGKCSSRLPFLGADDQTKWCTFKFHSRITSLTPSRIEGESEVWASSDVDVGKCEVKKRRMQQFVWIPKG